VELNGKLLIVPFHNIRSIEIALFPVFSLRTCCATPGLRMTDTP
jgi:hypothetical protein